MSALMKHVLFGILLLLIPAILCQPPNTLETITADIYGTSSVPNSFAYTGSTLRTAQNNTVFIDRRQSKAVVIADGQTETACLLRFFNVITSESDYDITTNGEWIATAVTGFLGNEISIFKCENGTATNIQPFQDSDALVIQAVQFLDGGLLVTIASPSYAVDISVGRIYTYDGSKWVGGGAWTIIGPIVFVDPVALPALGDIFSKRNYQFQDDYATFITNLQHSFFQISIYNTTTWTSIDRMLAPDELDKTPFLDVAFNGKDSVIASRSDVIYILNYFIIENSPIWEEVYRVNATALGFDSSFNSGFGFSLASVNQDTFLVTAPTDKRYSNNTGLVLVFKRINGIWSWVTNIQSSIKQSYFAQEIAITNDRIIFDGDVAFQSIPRCAFEPLSYQCLEHANLSFNSNCDLDPSTICTTEQMDCFSFDRFVVKNRTRLNDTTIEVNFEIHGKIAQSVSKSVIVTCPLGVPPTESNIPVFAAPSSTVSPSIAPQGNDKGITSNSRSIVRGAWFLVSLISFFIFI